MALILRWCIAGRIMSLLDFWFPLTASPGPGTVDLYLAEHPQEVAVVHAAKGADQIDPPTGEAFEGVDLRRNDYVLNDASDHAPG